MRRGRFSAISARVNFEGTAIPAGARKLRRGYHLGSVFRDFERSVGWNPQVSLTSSPSSRGS